MVLMRVLLIGLLLGGNPVWAQQGPSVELKAVLGGKAMLSIDGQQQILAPGQSKSGVRLVEVRRDGSGVTVEIGAERLEVGFGASVSSRFAAPETVETRIFPDRRGMYTAVGSINGMPTRFLVDTGATFVGLDAEMARRVGVRYKLDGRPEPVQTAAGLVTAYRVRLDRVSLGGITLNNVEGHVVEEHSMGMPLLGMSFLGRLQVANENGGMVLRYRR